MAKIEVTRREFHQAWKAHRSLWESAQQQNNASLTCLFYAIECGLKAVILKQEGRELSGPKEGELGHDINKMLSILRVQRTLLINADYLLNDLKNPNKPRNASQDQINQVFRYGVMFKSDENKVELTERLTAIVRWIDGVLR